MNAVQAQAVAADDVAPTIDHVLRDRLVTPLFQPIVDLATRTVVAAEALARGPAGSPLQFPDRLFAAALEAGRLGEMDLLCAERALECAIDSDAVAPLLFVNAEPSVLDQPLSPRLLEMLLAGLPFRMVLEYTERALPTVPGALLRIAAQAEALGNGIALDDVGADPMSLAFLPLIEPEVIKLDMGLLQDRHSATTRETCRLVTLAARRTGAVVIAEGIETEADLHAARDLGADWGQGWLFGRPGPLARRTFAGGGRPAATLRPPQPGLHQPAAAPVELASAHGTVRTGTSGDFLRHVTAMCASIDPGDHAVVLASCADAATAAAVGALLDDRAPHAAYRAVLGPASADRPYPDQDAVVVVRAEHAEAVCRRTGASEDSPLIHTDHFATAVAVGRAVLQRLV